MEEETVEVRPGRHIWVERGAGRHAEGDLPLAFLVHGGCAHARQWAAQADRLSELGVPTVAFDMLGCGRSAKPRNWGAYHPEELYQDLLALFRSEAKGRQKVLVLAHSFGAALAVRLAGEEAGRVVGLLLVGPYVPGSRPRPSLFSLARWLFHLPEWVLRLMQPGLTDAFLHAAFARRTRTEERALVESERRCSNANPPHMFKAFHRQLGQLATAETFAGWLGRVQQPVCLVFGDEDAVTPLYPGSTLLSRSLPSPPKLVVVQHAAHQAMQERPGEVNAAAEALLTRL